MRLHECPFLVCVCVCVCVCVTGQRPEDAERLVVSELDKFVSEGPTQAELSRVQVSDAHTHTHIHTQHTRQIPALVYVLCPACTRRRQVQRVCVCVCVCAC